MQEPEYRYARVRLERSVDGDTTNSANIWLAIVQADHGNLMSTLRESARQKGLLKLCTTHNSYVLSFRYQRIRVRGNEANMNSCINNVRSIRHRHIRFWGRALDAPARQTSSVAKKLHQTACRNT